MCNKGGIEREGDSKTKKVFYLNARPPELWLVPTSTSSSGKVNPFLMKTKHYSPEDTATSWNSDICLLE